MSDNRITALPPDLSKCLGYCGRVPEPGLNLTAIECGMCPRAHRSDGYVCVPCAGQLEGYSIVFIVVELLSLYLQYQGVFVSMTRSSTKRKTRIAISVYLVLELVLAVCCTLLSLEPKGSLRVYSCGMSHVNDWYPVFFNPKPDYIHAVHCANEVAFPLITFYLLFLGFIAAITILIRLPLLYSQRVVQATGVDASYMLRHTWALLFAVPVLALVHVALGGLVFYAFPFLLFASFLFSCLYAAVFRDNLQAFKTPLRVLWTGFRFYVIPFGCLYCMRELFGARSALHWIWIALGPLVPAAAIQATWRFTDERRFT
ncbi:hypothetical protein PTSG_09535 [Salpingoeca rosetta]|uniref:JNK1/MAPK8-associated membrane protein n=1 Tax=Salpingoeca rosetta (strain ATCC 50818 / BSB-021) TaxID=946362 RepID=F2ULA1_SALR5|nr:uncharacterized protein PTSG_09535 [Salpingoeca rosetta]EGD77900.1 hypothetical protein PTSG_09535 [Salpingoeca rosetta]|eukprot:XP_004989964.1 hypothetical protein PTSG_09535 [Salpingoeca rosetta]